MFWTQPPPGDVATELSAMRAEIAEIRRAQSEAWIDGARAEDVRRIVQDALADSATRTSFAASDWSSGYDDGAYIKSADGCWSLKVGVMAQIRFVFNSASGSPNAVADESTRWGTEPRRINVTLSGNAIDPSITWLALFSYQSQVDRFIAVANEVRPLYSWINKDLGQGWSTCIGLQNVPWDLESDFYGSSKLVVGDYSTFNYRFGAGKQAGVLIKYCDDLVRIRAGAFNQVDVATSQWNGLTNLSFAVASRTEFKFGGDWQQLEWGSSKPGDTPGVVAGLGLIWSNGRAQNPPNTPAAQGVTTDLRAALAGVTLVGQFAYMRDAVGESDLGWSAGLNLLAAVFVLPTVEAFTGVDYMNTSDVPWILQSGANWFIHGTALKFTLKTIVPFGSGQINGIRQIAGGIGLAQLDNNASVIAQLQMSF